MRSAIALVLVLMLCAPVLAEKAELSPLPALNTLTELPVKLIKDFTANPDIASPALPVAAGEGNFFFYDYKLKRLCKVNLRNNKVLPVGRFGEGPKEYTSISSLWGDDAHVYCIDRKGKICCFGLNGTFQWEERLDKAYPRFLGIDNGSVFLSTFGRYSSTVRTLRLFHWKRGRRISELMNLPVEFIATQAFHISGKLMKGGGIHNVAVPAVAIWNGKLVTSAYEDFRFDIRDLGKKSKVQVAVNAPAPVLNPRLRKIKNIQDKKNYAIRQFYPMTSCLAVISNYYRGQKPRIDFFGPKGTLLHSYILPFEANGGGNDILIHGDYLFHSQWDEVGFKVYKINLKI